MAVFAISTAVALAAAGSLDQSFGTGGKVALLPAGWTGGGGYDIALQPDGKPLITGNLSDVTTQSDFAVARLTASGAPDPTFGGGDGVATTSTATGTNFEIPQAVAVTPDGKVVIAGYRYVNLTDREVAFVRYNVDGTLDDTFDGDANNTTAPSNGNGIVTLAISTNDVINDVIVQPDGKIVAVGYSGAGPVNGLVLRLTGTGALDTSFNATGYNVPSIATDLELFEAITRDAAGRYWASGRANMPGPADDDFLTVRLTDSGALDATFDGDSSNTYGAPGNGVVTTAISTMLPPTANYDRAQGNALTADGRLIAGGWAQVNGVNSEQFALVKYAEDGSLDGSFGGDGRVTVPITGAADLGEKLAVQPDGKVLLGGGVNITGDNDFAAIRVNADGSLDPSFGAGGVARTDLGATNDYANGLALQPDGKVVLGGFGGNAPFALLRYEADPPPVTTTPPLQPLTVSITKPRGKTVKRRNSRTFAGTAGPVGQVAKVEIALRRVDRSALRRGRCLWLRDRRKTKFRRTRATGRKCSRLLLRKASGTDSWTYRLGRPLPVGSYELYVKVTLNDGRTHDAFTRAIGNLHKFRVR